MAVPYYCRKCGDVIGSEPEELTIGRAFSGNFDSSMDVDCPGRGNHTKPNITESTRLFGLLRRVFLEYPETSTTSSWEEYIGPPSKFWLWFAIVFWTRRYPNGNYAGVTVNGKWVWWDRKKGFFGDGVAEFANLEQVA